MADKVKVSVLEVNSTELFEPTERLLTSDIVDFDNTGKKFSSTDVADALDELRNKEVLSISMVTTTLNGNKTLTATDHTLQIIEGTEAGFSITLPNATTLFKGHRFEISNEAAETIEVKDSDGIVLADLISGDVAKLTLENNITTAGEWLNTIVSSAATGITSYSVGSDTLFTTTSPTDVLITGMTVTPVSGRYAVWFSSDIEIQQNNKLADVVLAKDAVAIERTRREVQGVSSNFISAFITIGEVTVNGSEELGVYTNISSGSLDVNQRRLILIRLGA